MKKPPHIKLYVKDFSFDIQDMSNEEIGVYMRGFLKCYKDGKIPAKKQEETLYKELQKSFTTYQGVCDTNRKNRTKTKACKKESSTNGQRMVDDPVNQEPLTINQEPLTKKEESTSVDFETFWKIYPKTRAGSKEKSKSAYLKALKDKRATVEEIKNGTEKYAVSDEVKRGYAKGCAAWLNDDRWNSHYDTQPIPAHDNSNPQDDRLKARVHDTARFINDLCGD